jgi:hypothetical protein
MFARIGPSCPGVRQTERGRVVGALAELVPGCAAVRVQAQTMPVLPLQIQGR